MDFTKSHMSPRGTKAFSSMAFKDAFGKQVAERSALASGLFKKAEAWIVRVVHSCI